MCMHFVAAAALLCSAPLLLLLLLISWFCYDALSAATATRQVAIVEWTLRGAGSDSDRSFLLLLLLR